MKFFQLSRQSLEKKKSKNKTKPFLKADSGSKEQQVLHIKYVKYHQKTAVLQHNVQKHLGGKSVFLTNNKPQT